MNAPATRPETPDVAKLLASLADEAAAQGDLAEILRRKERLLIAGDAAGLQELIVGAAGIVGRLEELAIRRGKIVHALGRKLRTDPNGLRIRDIAALAAPTDRAELMQAADRLRTALEAVRVLNRRCIALARQGAELNRALVHVLFGTVPPSGLYGRNGRRLESPAVESGFAREA